MTLIIYFLQSVSIQWVRRNKTGTKEKLYSQLPDCGWTHWLFLISWGRSWCFKTTVMCLALPSSVSCTASFMVIFFLYCSLSWVRPWKRHRTTFSCCLQVLPFLNSVGIQFLSSFLCIVTYSVFVSSPWAFSLQVWFLASSKFSLNCSLTVITCFSALTWFGLHSCF